MNRASDKSRNGLFSHQNMFRAAGILIFLTLLSVWWVCGLFAKYKGSDTSGDTASAAAFAEISVQEHEVLLENGVYSLDTDSVVSGNSYPVILPGTVLPKDPFIEVTDTSDTACAVYLETVDEGKPDEVTYTINSEDWSATDELAPSHGGTVYKYREVLPAHTGAVITDIITDNELAVSDSLKDKSAPAENSDEFGIAFYAYLVQAD